MKSGEIARYSSIL